MANEGDRFVIKDCPSNDTNDGVVICEMYDTEQADETQANARLITAAPGLLAHLRYIASEAEYSRDNDDREPEWTFAKIADIARLAVAKAEDGNAA